MRFWEENRPLILGLVTALALMGFVRLAITGGANARAREIRRDLHATLKKLEAYHDRKFPELAEASEKFRAEIAGLESTLEEQYKRRLGWTFPAWVTQTKPGMSFSVHLATQIERVAKGAPYGHVAMRADEMGVDLAGNWLGFAVAGTWTEEDAKKNLKLLAIAENIALLACEAKVSRVLRITPSQPSETGALHMQKVRVHGRYEHRPAPYRVFIREYPVTIQMTGTPESIMRFLHSVRPTQEAAGGEAKPAPGERKQFLVIRRITVKSAGDEAGDGKEGKKIYVVIEAAGMSFLTPEEIKAREPRRPKPPTPPGDLKPLGA